MGPKLLAGVLGLAAVLVVLAWWGTRADPATVLTPPPEIAGADRDTSGPEPATPDVEVARRDAVVEAPAIRSTSSHTHRLAGRIVDERRQPVADARVTLADAPEVSAASGADGSFALLVTLAVSEPPRMDSVIGRDARGRMAVNTVHLAQTLADEVREVDAGTLVLLAGHPLRVTVRQQDAPVPGADVEVALGHTRRTAGRYRTDDAGEVVIDGLPPGPVHVTARHDGAEGRARVFVPEADRVSVDLQPLGQVEVHVVDARTGSGVAGAGLEVSESFLVPAALPTDLGGPRHGMAGEYFTSRTHATAETDEHGRALVDGLAPDLRYRLGVRAPGYAAASGTKLEAGDEPVRVELEPVDRRRVTWPVVGGELPVPPDGTGLEFRQLVGSVTRGNAPPVPSSGRMEGSTLVAEGVVGRASLVAATPDGALALLWAREDETLGAETSFRRARKIEVHVRDEAGAPVAGARVLARDQGNNPFGDAVPTDGEGLAVLEGLYGGLADVSVLAPGEPGFFGRTVGTVDLDEGDGRLEVVLTPPRRARARLSVRIDGAPALPAQFEVRAQTGVEVLEEVPERGELVLALELPEPAESVTVFLWAAGFAPAAAWFDLSERREEATGTVELERTSVLVAHVTRPAEGSVSIAPQRFNETRGEWGRASGMQISGQGLSYPNGPDDTWVFAGVKPGRWRVIDTRSEVASDEVTIDAGTARASVVLDLAVLEWVSGRVALEDPGELARVRVLVEDPGAEPTAVWHPGAEPPDGAHLRDDTFRVRVRSDREVTLVPWHPWLQPAPEGGRVPVRGGHEGVVLRLVTGDELRLPAPQLGRHHEPRLARYADGAAPEGEPLAWHHLALVDGVLRAALPRGRWTLVVDPGGDFAPLVLPGVEIDGVTELPAAEFPPGSALVVRVLVPEGSDAPRVYVFAERLDAPGYHRSVNSRGEAVVRLEGLGAGRFHVRMRPIMDFTGVVDGQEVELDGSTDVELELDLR